MTQTTSSDGTTAETPAGPDIPLHPSDILMTLIVAFLAPMFLGASGGDIGFARMAAIETVNAYRIRNQADLLAVAQIVAFGLAALGSLSLSMADDISLAMTLRLRGNANALNRSAEQNRRVLLQPDVYSPPLPQAAPMVEQHAGSADDEQTQAGHLLDLAAAQELAEQARARLRDASRAIAPAQDQAAAVAGTASTPANAIQSDAAASMTAEQRHKAMWAIAMVQEAGELAASIPNLPPIERRAASIRTAALSSTATELLVDGGS